VLTAPPAKFFKYPNLWPALLTLSTHSLKLLTDTTLYSLVDFHAHIISSVIYHHSFLPLSHHYRNLKEFTFSKPDVLRYWSAAEGPGGPVKTHIQVFAARCQWRDITWHSSLQIHHIEHFSLHQIPVELRRLVLEAK
jgi:hypothetical protein